jgi:hypothetical protein
MRETCLILAMLSCLGVGVANPQAVGAPKPKASKPEMARAAANYSHVHEFEQNDETTKDNASPEKAKQTKQRPKKIATRDEQQTTSDCWVNRTCVDP